MKLTSYIKSKINIIIISIISITLIILLDLAFKVPKELIIVTSFLLIITLIISLLITYFQKRNFYNTLITNTKNLDKKYLVLETLPKPNTYEEKLIYNTLYDINKSMIENVTTYITSTKDFKDYIEMWIHEVKIPISSLILMTHNHKDKIPQEYFEEIRRLDNYIDQILYYVRSNYTSEDFIFKKVKLEKVISQVALKNKDDLLENKIDLIVDIKNTEVYTDTKWLEFILNQIINNSIKYKKEIPNSYIKISALEDNNQVTLLIKDNGIGIPESDILNVFKKSFTGTNGRNKTKSTGMGLYIAKKLCTKLGHKIEIESKEKEYTILKITFGKNKLYHPED